MLRLNDFATLIYKRTKVGIVKTLLHFGNTVLCIKGIVENTEYAGTASTHAGGESVVFTHYALDYNSVRHINELLEDVADVLKVGVSVLVADC